MGTIILGIESSCDDTSAAIIDDNILLSNVIASQKIHELYGGVVPELASRAHQQNIIPVIDQAIKLAGIKKEDITAVAFTRGPGLMGSLLVGVSFAKAFSMALNIPMVEVHHMHAHVLAHFIQQKDNPKPIPSFPYLCLTVSGGHTQIMKVNAPDNFEIIGKTIDDAAGEAFDKAAKIMGLPYPGGPLVDKYAKEGNPDAFKFSRSNIADFDFSFSGLKTSFLYFVRDELKKDPDFIEKNKADLCASIQKSIIDALMHKLKLAVKHTGIKDIAIAGGVSANSGLRAAITQAGIDNNWNTFIPEFSFCTDNAAMIAISGYFKYLNKEFADLEISPLARM